MNTLVLRRKLIYVGFIALLLIPLYFLGHPSVRDQQGEPTNEGGTLARIRTRDDLGQSDLGALDPASESARLATLGLRGVAATILWQKAEYYKREKYFDRMAATVNQLKILQPHFVKVWDFQAHNLSYNISVEFDNYKHRYDWVKKGVYYLIEGTTFNKSRTELPFQLGDFIGSKMGIADEKTQYRELFRNDDNFHEDVNQLSNLDMASQAARGPDGKPDNWRAGAMWYQRSYNMVSTGSRPAKSPLMFYCKEPQWQLKHSEAIQTEGYLGEEARSAWGIAGEKLKEFGGRQIRTSYGTLIYLTQLELTAQQYVEKEREFNEFCGNVFTDTYAELESRLTDLQKTSLRKDPADLTVEEMIAAEEAKMALQIDPFQLARKLPSEKQLRALEMAKELRTLAERKDHIDRYRSQVNFSYWESRCAAEQDDSALSARTAMYKANAALDLGKLDEAILLYEEAWTQWNNLFNRFPEMMVDEAADDVEKYVAQYLQQIDKDLDDLPENFVLKNFLEFRKYQKSELADPAMMSLISHWSDRYPNRNFLDEAIAKSAVYAQSAQRRQQENETPLPKTDGSAYRETPRERPDAIEAIADPDTTNPAQPESTEPATAAFNDQRMKKDQVDPSAPKPEEPKPEEPKPEEPKPEEPKPEEPKPEEPKPEKP